MLYHTHVSAMRLRSLLHLALPVIALAEDQAPLVDRLRGWFNKASEYLPSAPTAAMHSPLDAGASKVAGSAVNSLNITNWKDVLAPGKPKMTGEPDEWMVFITGGNKTCHGLCDRVYAEWNVRFTIHHSYNIRNLLTRTFTQTSVALLSITKDPPKLGVINCETDVLLCHLWYITPPAIYHFFIPHTSANGPKLATSARYIELNRTTSDASEIVAIHKKKEWEKTAPYEGAWHPFDGWLAKSHLNVPLAYIYWAFAAMPAWMPMMIVTFISRSFMYVGLWDLIMERLLTPP